MTDLLTESERQYRPVSGLVNATNYRSCSVGGTTSLTMRRSRAHRRHRHWHRRWAELMTPPDNTGPLLGATRALGGKHNRW